MANCLIRLSGSRRRPVIRMTDPDGRIMAQTRVRPSESPQEAHLRFVRRLAEHPAFGGIVEAAGDEMALKEEEIVWD